MDKSSKRKENIAVTIALLVLAFFFIVAGVVFNIFNGLLPGSADSDVVGSVFEATENSMETSGGVLITNVEEGEGVAAKNGMALIVHYTGTFEDGTVFDSSRGGDPFQFVLGSGQVIPGWEEGLLGMKVGGIRTLTIPPELGYGEQGLGPIPGGATLIFDVELLGAHLPQSGNEE